MIRDPSDGTVREMVDENGRKSALKAKTHHVDNDLMASTTSGLREASHKDTYQVRLEWSRDWMKAYHASKEREHAERGSSSEQKLPSSGHPVEGQREAES